jgi:hypothetical protein
MSAYDHLLLQATVPDFRTGSDYDANDDVVTNEPEQLDKTTAKGSWKTSPNPAKLNQQGGDPKMSFAADAHLKPSASRLPSGDIPRVLSLLLAKNAVDKREFMVHRVKFWAVNMMKVTYRTLNHKVKNKDGALIDTEIYF